MTIRSTALTNPPKVAEVAESEAPEVPEGVDAQKPGDVHKMSRRMSNSAVAAASTVLARNAVSSSSQPGGRVRRMSLRASGQGERDKKEITSSVADTTAGEAIPFVDRFHEKKKSVLAHSPKRSPRINNLNGYLPATPRRLEGSTFVPVTPSMMIKGSSNKSLSSKSSKMSRQSQSSPSGTGLAARSPKHKIIMDDDDVAFGPPITKPRTRDKQEFE